MPRTNDTDGIENDPERKQQKAKEEKFMSGIKRKTYQLCSVAKT
jgi:hypothetical protein